MRVGLVLGFILPFFLVFNLESFSQSSFTGLIRNYNGVTFIEPDQFIVGRNLVRLNASHAWESGKLYSSGDILNSYLKEEDRFQLVLRETFIDLYLKRSEFRVGKQIVSRGRANGVIMSDFLNPIDLSEFLTQDLSDLRQGLWALRYQIDVGKHQLEWIVNPVKLRNILPDTDGIWDYRNSQAVPATLKYIDEGHRFDLGKSNIEMMLKLRPGILFNIDLGLAYWDYPMPSYQKKPGLGSTGFYFDLIETYPKSVVLSGSGDLQIRDGILLKAESVWFSDRTFDRELPSPPPPINGLNPDYLQGLVQYYNKDHLWLKKNSFSQNMLGVDYSSGSTFLAAQLLVDWIPGKSDDIAQSTTQTFASFLLRKDWNDGDLSAHVFSKTGLSINELWLNPELSWKPKEALQIALGAHVFSGSKKRDPYNFNLGIYKKNSFVFTKLSYSW